MFTRRVEDYLEAILNVAGEKGYAKIRDIASVLDVKPPTVVEMVKKLNDRGLVIYKRYDGVVLTPEGEEVAESVKRRHELIKTFLGIIKVPDAIADRDACTMEHELDSETVKQIQNLVEFVKTAPDYPEWLEHFEIFCETGEHQCEEKDKKNFDSLIKT
jgi:DtxR family Mn-dependent transcriptional regulator